VPISVRCECVAHIVGADGNVYTGLKQGAHRCQTAAHVTHVIPPAKVEVRRRQRNNADVGLAKEIEDFGLSPRTYCTKGSRMTHLDAPLPARGYRLVRHVLDSERVGLVAEILMERDWLVIRACDIKAQVDVLFR